MSGLDVTQWALGKRVVAGAIFGLFAVSGLATYNRLPRSEDPGFIVRQAVIVTEFPGASAARVEELITDPLEAGLQKLVGLDFVNSVSRAGQSVITVAAQETLPEVESMWDEMRERVDEQARALPPEAIGPFVNDDFGDVFGTLLALTGDGFNLAELEDVAEEVRKKFLQLPDVAKVELIGVAARRIFLEYDEARLAELGIGADQIAAQLRRQNIVSPSGRVNATDRVFEVQTEGSYESLDALAATLIRVDGRAFPLKALVRIRQGYEDDPPAPSMSFTGRPAIGIAISMAPGGKLTELGPRVRTLATKLTEGLPVGLELHLASYQTAVVESAVGAFVGNLLQSVVIVLAVMLVALGLRTGVIVGAMVPMTILTTFAIMGVAGIGINKMSLTALIIALGLLVDNGIVMSESILVRRNAGEPLVSAAIESARELRVPLLISSLTTVAALLPTYLAESTTGEYTSPIAEVVGIALLASWILSLTFVPLCCVLFMGGRPKSRASTASASTGKPPRTAAALRYRGVLEGFIRHRWLALAGFVVVLVGSGMLMQFVPQQFFPGKAWPQLTIELELPQGTPRAKTDRVVAEVERFFRADLLRADWSEQVASSKVAADVERQDEPGLVSWSAFIGEGAPRFVLGYAPEQPKENYAYFIVNVESYSHIAAVVERIETFIDERFPEALTRVLPLRNGPPLKYPVEIRLSGDDISALRRIVTRTEEKLRTIPGLIRVGNDWGPDRPRVRVNVDPVRLSAAGLTNADVAVSLETAFRGRALTVFRDGTDVVPVELRRADASVATVDAIRGVSVYRASGGTVPLLQVASVGTDLEPPTIRRRDRQRTITVRADIAPDAPAAVTAFSVAATIRTWLDGEKTGWPFGFDWSFGGEVESSGKANASIQAKQPIALLIIVFCLIFQFNTLREPLIVLLTLPFAITGVALGLFVTQKPFGFMALLGVIALFGIVINNAIVLLDRVQIEVRAGRSKLDAILDASERRLRPIALTTATTVAGLIPLALFGGPLFSPMAVALMSGLLASTFLTLGLVPVLYAILHRLPRPGGRRRPGAASVPVGVAGLALIATMGFAAGSEPAFAASPSASSTVAITADEAARRAAERTLDARVARADLSAAVAEEDRVIVDYLPRLAAAAGYRRLSDLTQPSLFGDTASLVVTERRTSPLTLDDLAPLPADAGAFPVILDQIEFSGRLTVPVSKYVFEISAALEAAGAGIDAAQLEVDSARVRAAASARIVFYRFVAAVQQIAVFEKRVSEAQERLRVSEEGLRAGRLAETEMLEAKSALAATRLALERARTERATSQEALRQATLDDTETTYSLAANEGLSAFDPPALPEPVAVLYDEAIKQRLERRRLRQLAVALGAAARLERARGLPVVEAFGSVLSANPNPRFIPNRERFDTTWEIGVRATWSPNDLVLGWAEGRTADAEAEKTMARIEALNLAIHREIVEARQSIIEARASLTSAQQGLEAALAAYAQRKLTYQEGATTVLDVLQSEGVVVAAELDAIRARIQARVARVRLDQATGRDVDAVLRR